MRVYPARTGYFRNLKINIASLPQGRVYHESFENLNPRLDSEKEMFVVNGYQ
jgi:hypothetical protein